MIRINLGSHEGSQEMDVATSAALASGRADAAVALFMDSVMALRGRQDWFAEALSGTILERETPADMRADALTRVLAAIDAGAPQQKAPAKASRLNELISIPAALKDVIAEAEQGKGWKSAAPGVKQLKLGLSGDVDAEIFRIEPGVAIPKHTHKGNELTLCLVGGFSDHRSSYEAGDVAVADPSVHHRPKAHDDGVCFVLAITDAGLKFDGALGAIQKLLGR